MVINPLFAPDDDDKRATDSAGFVVSNRHGRTIEPLDPTLKLQSSHPAYPARHVTPVSAAEQSVGTLGESSPAVELIRRKLDTLYAQEPQAADEILVESGLAAHSPQTSRSKHQQFMHDLSISGKSLAEIQTAWHDYYTRLPDDEKHMVWQEFYAANNRNSAYSQFAAGQQDSTHINQTDTLPKAPQNPVPAFLQRRSGSSRPGHIASTQSTVVMAEHVPSENPAKVSNRHVAALKRQIKDRVKINGVAQTKARQHLHSLLFGLATSAIVMLIVLFGLFNEVVLTPFIQPSRHASATPIILDPNSVAPTTTPEVIIPKINVEIPVDYTQTTTDERVIESALQDGTVHYASTSKPGEKGNVAVFGHSSNNIFNPGKYKFAFVLLHTLVPGDIFYLTYGNKVYSYRVYDKQIVSPTTVSILDPVAGKLATATLITCDPPGTSLNRLVVWGEQISPDPNGDGNATSIPTAVAPTQLSGNGPTLWQRIVHWF